MNNKNTFSPSPLDRALERFQSLPDIPKISSTEKARKNMDKVFAEEYRRRAKHPGLYFLSDLYFHSLMLNQFLQGIEDILATPDDISRIGEFVYATYSLSPDGVPENPVLEIRGEPNPPFFGARESYEKYVPLSQTEIVTRFKEFQAEEIKKDIEKNAPGVTPEILEKWQSIVRELEIQRTKFLATAAALTEIDTGDQTAKNQQAHLIRKLLRIRSNFSESFFKLTSSGAMSHMLLAINETRKMIKNKHKNNDLPIPFGDLPTRLYRRHWDYASHRGRNHSQLEDEPTTSLDHMIEEYKYDVADTVDIQADIQEKSDQKYFRSEMEKLPADKLKVVKKYLRKKEKLDPRERQIISRLKKALKHRPVK